MLVREAVLVLHVRERGGENGERQHKQDDSAFDSRKHHVHCESGPQLIARAGTTTCLNSYQVAAINGQ